MKRKLSPDEHVVYRLKKQKSRLAAMAVFVPVWLLFGVLFLVVYGRYRFVGAEDVAPGAALAAGLMALLVLIPVALMILFGYFVNDLVVTDRRVYVRAWMPPRAVCFNLEDVRSFQHAYSTGRRGQTNNRIYFYLLCGGIVKTGDLFISPKSLEALLGLLRERYEGRGFTGRELHALGRQNPGAEKPVAKLLPAVFIALAAPVLLAVLMLSDYLLCRA